uniref:Uncharacterized protein n=1 Tax=Micrurus spixii TaxID=129469 RepID=A0A2D4MCE0_9SAUR
MYQSSSSNCSTFTENHGSKAHIRLSVALEYTDHTQIYYCLHTIQDIRSEYCPSLTIGWMKENKLKMNSDKTETSSDSWMILFKMLEHSLTLSCCLVYRW